MRRPTGLDLFYQILTFQIKKIFSKAPKKKDFMQKYQKSDKFRIFFLRIII